MANHASSLPSPASANSSSTLIVTPLPMSLKQDVLGSHTVHNMNSDLTTASDGNEDDERDICASKPLGAPGEPLPAPQTLPSSQVLPESQSGGPMFPSMRSAGQLGTRVPSGASSQTRMSERGFVEPHHSNVPRRSRTRVKTKMTVDAANPESEERVQDASRSPTSPAHAHAPSSPPVPPPLSISEEPKPILIPAPPIPLLTPSLNPHSARMPDQLLSLRLPTTPPPPHVPQSPGGLLPSSSIPHAPLAGLPQGIGLGLSTPISTPQFGVGMQPTTQRIATPAAIGGTLGSGRLPTRRRRVAAGSPTPVGRVPFQGLKSSALGKEDDLAFGNTPTTAQELESDPVPSTAPVATTSQPPVVPVDTPHGPPTYPAHIRTLQVVARQKREEARAERRQKRVWMGIQRVGKNAGVEVGFLDSELKNEREVEDGVDADSEIKGAYVLLHVVDSDSESSDDDDSEDDDIGSPLRRTLSSRAFSKRRSRSAHVRSVAAPSEPSASASASTRKDRTTRPGRSHSIRKRKARERERPARAELKLSLPTDRKAFVDGSCALSTAQVWEACTFVKGILEDTGEGERRWKDRVRILAPRGRPEDAMGVAIAYLAYGRAAAVTSTPAGPSGPSTSTSVQTPGAARLLVQTATSTSAEDEESIGMVGGWSRRDSMAVPGDTIDVVVDIEGGGNPSGVGVEVELGNDNFATSTTITEPETTQTSTIDDSAETPVDIIFYPDPDPEIAYTAAHTLTMALLDEGDWVSRGTLAASGTTTAAAMSNTTTQGEHLGAGRGIVGVVDMEHPGRGGLALGLGMLDGEEEEDDDYNQEWDGDEERSSQSDDGEDDDEEGGDEDVLSSSAGARVDSHSGSEAPPPPPPDAYIPLDLIVTPSSTPADAIRDADGDEDEDNDDGRRRGRTVTWHGVPMPPKFVEQSPSTSLSRPPPPIRRSAKSKSKSRVRGRARSQATMLGSTREGDEDRNDEGAANDNEDDSGREQEPRARSRRRMSRAREARREERRRARKRDREAEKEYFGIGDAWRGVLSFEGLSGIGEMMKGWSGLVEG